MIIKLKPAELATLIGKQFEPSPWFLVDQQRINAFADTTQDHQFIHVDPQRAAQTPFKGTIAHGFLTLSLLSHLCSQSGFSVAGMQMSVNYGLNKVRFINPVRSGSEIRAIRSVKNVEERQAGQYLVTSEATVEIKGESKPALIAEWLGLIVMAP